MGQGSSITKDRKDISLPFNGEWLVSKALACLPLFKKPILIFFKKMNAIPC